MLSISPRLILLLVAAAFLIFLILPGQRKKYGPPGNISVGSDAEAQNFPARVDCIDIPRTYGKSNYLCKGKGLPGNCYAIGKNEGFPGGFADYVGSNIDLMCNSSPLCSDVGSQCGLYALQNL